MGLSAICNTYSNLLDGWRQSDVEAHERVVKCKENVAAKIAEGYKKTRFGYQDDRGVHHECGWYAMPVENTCEAKVKHYAADLAKHIYQETKLPDIQEEAYYPHKGTILDQCRSISEGMRNSDRRPEFIAWSEKQDQLRDFSKKGAYEQKKLAEIAKTHPEEGEALSTLYKDYGVNLFKNSLDKHKYDAKESGIEAQCSKFIRDENSRTNFKIAGVVLFAIAVISIAAKVYCDKQKEKEKQKTQGSQKI